MAAAKEALTDAKIDGVTLQVSEALEAAPGKRRIMPAVMGSPERVVRDLEQVKALAARLEKELDADDRGSKQIEERFLDASSDDHPVVRPRPPSTQCFAS